MVNISQHTFRLYKREKLCSDTAIDLLFSRQGGGQAALSFPLRVVWRHNQARSGGAQFMISVPKKRLRHGVDRVAMRRLIREAYRLNRRHLGEAIDMPVDIAFAYVADRHTDFRRVSHAMIKSLRRIAKSVLPNDYDSETDNSTRDKVQQ